MTTYEGGKKKLGFDIYNVLQSFNSKLDYFEPFVGMCGVIRYFSKDRKRKLYACDKNKDVILMWKAVQKGWNPPQNCTLSYYESLKNSSKNSAERGFIGSACSFGGSFFSGYRGKYSSNNGISGALKNIENIKPDIDRVKFLNSDSYDSFDPKNMLVYCDPPYTNSSKKSASKLFRDFDSEKFWNVMRDWSKDNIVVISEETAPKDFKCIWKKKIDRRISNNRSNPYGCEECLFVHKSIKYP